MGQRDVADGRGGGRLRLLLSLVAAAAGFGGLLGLCVAMWVVLFTDWLDVAKEFFHHGGCFLIWGDGCPGEAP
ncbi:hypothetical protein ACF9IK_02885 [Kitasatospora hibisci]|uniref:hypothetical protein n=1 Tax=Kitasatospora hibisci TaxID=3369522 RepID=UPI00375411F9